MSRITYSKLFLYVFVMFYAILKFKELLGGAMKKIIWGLLMGIILMSTVFAEDVTTGAATKVRHDQLSATEDFIYTNHKYGFRYDYVGMLVDDSNERIRTTFKDVETVVDIYYENFRNSIHSSNAFTVYGNRSIVDSDYITVTNNTWMNKDGYKVHLIEWERQPLKYMKSDKCYYATMDIIKNNMEVYNITINSIHPISPHKYLERFSIVAINEVSKVNHEKYEREMNVTWSEETKKYYNEAFVESEEIQWGIFEPSSAWGLGNLHKLEKEVGYKFDMLLQYYDLTFVVDEANLRAIYNENRVLEFTFQTTEYLVHNPDFMFDVMNGVYDEKIDTIIRKISRVDGPVLFRLNNEMNGDWCLYNAFWFQKDTRIYTELWRHLYERFEVVGADNIIWVFNPNERSFPEFKWNHYSNYFPGESYVDILGVTGYNTGNFYRGETWRDFSTIYDAFMPEYEHVFSDYPKMVTEFGSSTIGGDKAAWMADMFESIESYDLKAGIYWNGVDWTPNKEPARIYRFDDDPEVVEVFKKYLNIKR